LGEAADAAAWTLDDMIGMDLVQILTKKLPGSSRLPEQQLNSDLIRYGGAGSTFC
jgi:hypothetical protein